MSRLDSKAEPSMEDILASIRKIIAEEPPGSRPGPVAGRTSAGATGPAGASRGFMARDTFLKTSTPEVTAPFGGAAPAPSTFGATIARNSEPAPRPEPFLPFQKITGDSDGGSDSVLPGLDEIRAKLSAASSPFAKKAEAPPSSPAISAPIDAPTAIEAQLNDLLSDFAHDSKAETATDTQVAGAAEENNASSTAATNTDRAAGNPSLDALASDPFAFDLGPSPFTAKRGADDAPSVTAARTDFETSNGAETITAGALSDVDALPLAVEPPKPEVVTVSAAQTTEALPAVENIGEAEIVISAGAVQGAVQDEDASQLAPIDSNTFEWRHSSTAAPSFALPSVSATISPPGSTAPAELRPLAEEKISAPLRPHEPLAQPALADLARIDSRFSPSTVTEPSTALTPSHQAALVPSDSSMEDAVADLLRPMLRTWLAENMPRIVERALRREMQESSGQRKGAAE